MKLNSKDVEAELKEAKVQGYKLTYCTGTFRGRSYVSEVSGAKKTSSGLVGFSYQSCELSQRQMRRILEIAKKLGAKAY
jgi:hypothetical protein